MLLGTAQSKRGEPKGDAQIRPMPKIAVRARCRLRLIRQAGCAAANGTVAQARLIVAIIPQMGSNVLRNSNSPPRHPEAERSCRSRRGENAEGRDADTARYNLLPNDQPFFESPRV
ncbi:hypothetical protein [Bradyrhizobium sp. NAS96.2]|uniref:hypothetical protein n=1 Tax=Bradyrhizobium sp. NAS96.2 TaxID=1680160 RepID=UPI00093FE1C6|nr:hypothetical protein [Bradyrhizobium sp. NAS96.2]OKO76215.1 hypothetical protein AC628_18235 [Bradyrhizobium sp. NAS96.2]